VVQAQTQREAELVAGRYRIVRELARGGVGAVYEALDESTGRKVALKRLLASVADKPRLALLFEAEYDTLMRLKHPHIVEALDYGIDKRGPYFTMELLDGQDLSELEPIPYREACRYLRDVASSLALLHTRQRLHRDLSPRNVRLTSDGRCRLLDFGTMAGFGVSDDIVGTPPLVPPEALRGTALDHRADLYSLGALAYRILSGRYPYRARQLEDLPELWRTPPTRLREVAPEVPAELEELVMSMLSLDPTFRPNTTYEVIDRLTAVAELPPDEYQSRTAQGYLVGSRLIGRTRQMASIQRRIQRAQRERGGTVVIEGNPGVGKSRLLDEAALQAQLAGALTVRVDARAHTGEYGAIAALIRAIVEAAPHDARDAATPYLAGLARVSSSFSASPRSGVDPGSASSRAQVHNAVLNWLFDLAEDRTLVLLIDDLTRLDDHSTALLNSLSQAIPSHRILLIAARRLADQVAVPASADALVARARCLRLHRFSREETLALLQSLFGPVPNVELLGNWIHDVTTGFPMQIMELARHFVIEKVVRFVDGMWVLPPSVPQDSLKRNLAATLSARAAALPPAERALAEALSVRRGHLSLTLCMRLSDDKDTRALFRTLDELVAKGVLVSGANGYHFGQDALREVFLRRLSPKRARRLHRRLGEALLQYDSGSPSDLIEAGYNLIRGGAEMRGADLIASVAKSLHTRGATTIAALPAIEAALEVYEHWGRPARDCLRLRTVLASALDKRTTALYADGTLQALCAAAGGERARAIEPWLGKRARFVVGFAATQGRYWLTPRAQRGPRPQVALIAFFRVAFSVLSVRSASMDADGLERMVVLAQRLQHAGPLPALVAQTFDAQLRALRGDIENARSCSYALIARLESEPGWLRAASPATVSAITAIVHIGAGMLEAQYSLHSDNALAVVEALKALAQRARALQATPYADSKDAVDEVELELAAEQLDKTLHLARGERYLADAPGDASMTRTSTLAGMHHQFEVWRNAIDCVVSVRTMDVASLRRAVETFTHYVAEQPWLIPWLEVARAHLQLCLGKPQEALLAYTKWLDVIRPGRSNAWDTLYYGYADALIMAGEAARAREWLTQLLQHPVLVQAHETTARVTREAQLAWAEAECGALDAAGERIQRLEREIVSSDHPLVTGFVHEVGARVAHRARHEERQAEQLSLMKRQYTLTRDQALLARGQRVQDSFGEARPSAAGPSREKDRDRVVTKVTTRRETNLE
jgi:tetratricopeptide (TPR) repeat protein